MRKKTKGTGERESFREFDNHSVRKGQSHMPLGCVKGIRIDPESKEKASKRRPLGEP